MSNRDRPTTRLLRYAAVGAAASGAFGAGYLGLVTGALTLDLGMGRRTRALGPLTIGVAAPRETVFEVASAPYAERRPRAMRDKVDILERTDQMVLAAHRTPLGKGLIAVTVETVTFDPPHTMGFRLVRGPVPHVRETFALTQDDGVTTLRYDGELGTDLWAIGEKWGAVVAVAWVETVRRALADIKTESERRAAR